MEIIILCGKIFPCFKLNMFHWSDPRTHPQQSIFQTPQSRGWVLLLQCKKSICRPFVLHQLPVEQWGGPVGHGRSTYTIGADLALSLLWVKAFVPFSVWPIMFSLVTPIPGCSGQKSLDFYSWWLAVMNFAILLIVEVLPSIVMGAWCFTYNGKSNPSLFCLFD